MDQNVFNQASPENSSAVVTPMATAIYAGFWRRFIAAFIDGIVLAIIGAVLGYAFGGDLIVGYAVNTVLGILYFGVFDSSEMMGTPGKALLGIVLVRDNSLERVSFKTAVIRYLLKSLSCLILMIGYLMQPFTRKRQTLHDMITETVVIKKDIGDINYFKAFKENFKKIID